MLKAFKVLGFVVLAVFLLLVGLMIYINSAAGQRFVKNQVEKYVGRKIETPFSIGKMEYHLPDWVVVHSIYLEDQQGDTLLMAGKIRVDIDMLGLVRGNVIINSIELDKAIVKLYTPENSRDFNYQFLADAVSGSDSTTTSSAEPASSAIFRIDEARLADVRFLYKDIPGGIDFHTHLEKGHVNFETLDLNTNSYHIDLVEVEKGKAYFRSFPAWPKDIPEPESPPLDVQVNRALLESFEWNYQGQDIGIANEVKAELADIRFDKIDLENQEIVIRSADLEKTAVLVNLVEPLDAEAIQEAAVSDSSSGWKIQVTDLNMDDSEIHYRDDLAKPVLKDREFNSSDFTFSEVNLEMENFLYDGLNTSGKITTAKLRERSGLDLRELSADFLYSDKRLAFDRFQFETPHSDFEGDIDISYKSMDAFVADPISATMNIGIRKGIIGLEDIFLFSPELRGNTGLDRSKTKAIQVSGNLKALNGNFTLDQVLVSAGSENRLKADGTLRGLNNPELLKANLTIGELRTSRNFYQAFIPENVDLSAYNLPEKISVTGSLKGDARELDLDGVMDSDLGSITLKGTLLNLASETSRAYEGFLKTEDLALQNFFDEAIGLGSLSTELRLKADATFAEVSGNGKISKLVYKEHTYTGINLDMTLVDSILTLHGGSTDPLAHLRVDFESNLRHDEMSFNGMLDIQNLELEALHLANVSQSIKGTLKADIGMIASDYLQGTATFTNLNLGETEAGNIQLNFSKEGNDQKASLESGFAQASLVSGTGLSGLTTYLEGLTADSTGSSEPEGRLGIEASLINHPLWQELVPGLYIEMPLKLKAGLNNRLIEGDLAFDELIYKDYSFSSMAMKITGSTDHLKAISTLEDMNLAGYHLRENELDISYSKELLDLAFRSEDSTGNLQHELVLAVQQPTSEQIISLKSLAFEKQQFTVSENRIQVTDGNKLLAGPFTLTSGEQQIEFNADEQNISLNIKRLQLAPFYRIVNGASVEVTGLLGADIRLGNDLEDISGEGNLQVSELTVDGKAIGTLELDMPRFNTELLALDGNLTGPGSDARFGGTVRLEGEGKLDIRVDLKKLDAALIKAFSYDYITAASGELFGEISITESFESPRPDGFLGFRKFDVTPSYLGTPLQIDNQRINFQNRSIAFKNFTVLDSLNQKLVFDGSVNWSNLEAISYNLSLNTKDFLLMDTQASDNEVVYGTLKLDAELRMAGVGDKPDVDGKVRIRKGSDITFVMPMEIQTAETQGLVYFVPPADSLAEIQKSVRKLDTLNAAESFGDVINEILVALETDEEASFKIVVDEMNGDQLVFSGTSNLTFGLYPNGQQYLIGSFDLTKGSYSFSLEVFKREFQVVKGSRLTWNGDPYKANMEITAAYEVNTDIQSLNAFGLNSTSYGKVPINVLLKLTGSIDKPIVNFDLAVSDKAENSVKSLIESYDIFASLRQSPSEMNQQVFSLILFNRFMSDQLLSFSGGGVSGESVARQSVSKLLTEQLNVLAGNVLGNVGLTLGLNSDVFSGSQGKASRTEFNVGLKRNFLNDRIRVSLGKNFELASTTGMSQNSTEVLDNIDIEYLVTPDGRYVVKIYRDNEYQTVLEGFVIETGIGFELRANYDKFSEIFKRKGRK